jgi:hypothetical protein
MTPRTNRKQEDSDPTVAVTFSSDPLRKRERPRGAIGRPPTSTAWCADYCGGGWRQGGLERRPVQTPMRKNIHHKKVDVFGSKKTAPDNFYLTKTLNKPNSETFCEVN